MTSTIGMDPYFLATQTQMPYDAYAQYYAQLLAGAQQNQGTQTATSNVTFQGTQPQVKRAAQEEKSGAGTAITLGTIATLGAVAFFGHRSGKNILKDKNFFETTWAGIKSWLPKFGQQADNLIKSSQEYTLVKDGMTITVKDGKIAKILEKNDVDILKGDKLTKWLNDNKETSRAVKNLKFKKADTLPDGVTVRYTKKIGEQTFIVENGDVVQIIDSNNRTYSKGTLIFNQKLKNYSNDVEIATTLKRKLSNVDGINGPIIAVKNKNGIKYLVNGNEATTAEIQKIERACKKEIEKIGKEPIVSDLYEGITLDNYVYQKGNDRVYFNLNKNNKFDKVTKVEKLTEKTIEGDDITKYLDDNELKDQLNTIMNDGKLSDGWGFGELFVKTDGGHICEISDNGKALKSIKLNKEFTYNGNTYKSGDKIEGDVLEAWKKDSSNASEIEKILELLK